MKIRAGNVEGGGGKAECRALRMTPVAKCFKIIVLIIVLPTLREKSYLGKNIVEDIDWERRALQTHVT